MAPDLIRKIAGALSAASLGILFLCGLFAVIVFSKFIYDITKHLGKYALLQPAFYSYHIYISGLCVAISGGIAAFTSFLSLIISGAMSRNRTIILLFGSLMAIFTCACMVAEVLFYQYLIKEYLISNENFKISAAGTQLVFFQHYRNSSKVEKYIKTALADFYNQGYKSLREKYPNVKDVQNLLDWDSLQGYIGTRSQNNHIFNYPDLWDASVFFPLENEKTYLIFQEKDGLISAHVSSKSNYDHIIASLRFLDKGEDQFKRLACWNATNDKYECVTLTHTEKSGVATHNFASKPWTLGQTFTFPKEYYSLTRSLKENITVTYLLEHFPIAYRILSKADVDAGNVSSDYPFYYETDTNHYQFSAQEFVKAVHKYKNYLNTKIQENMEFYWCKEKPSNWEDAFVNKVKENINVPIKSINP